LIFQIILQILPNSVSYVEVVLELISLYLFICYRLCVAFCIWPCILA